MNNNNYNNVINTNILSNIKITTTYVIDNTFSTLNITERKLLTKYLIILIVITSLMFYENKNDFFNQITLNNNRDIYSLLVLLLPFYNLDKTSSIFSLEEIFYNKNNNAIKYESSYYVDHNPDRYVTNKNIISIETYLQNNIYAIYETMLSCKHKLYTNWLNIFPYSINDFNTTNIYKNFTNLFSMKKFNNKNSDLNNFFDTELISLNENKFLNNNFILGYDTLYGCIANFLYNDIKTIKWMIYDIVYENNILPTIILLNKILDNNIENSCLIPYKKLDANDKQNLLLKWNYIINVKIDDNYNYIKSFVLFYLKWETDETNLFNINKHINTECRKLIHMHINNIYDDNYDNNDDENFIYQVNKNNQIDICLINLIQIINFERLYEYLFVCMQQFRYTWYGYCCLSNDKKIKDISTYLNEYNSDKIINVNPIKPESRNIVFDPSMQLNGIKRFEKYLITPKNIYNYCKSLIHYTNSSNKFVPFNSYKLNSLTKNKIQHP